MYIVTAKEMYEMDRHTIQEIGLDERLLMENAGRAVSSKITGIISKQNQICIFVGSGNNGGDGFVIARTLHTQNYNVTVLQIVPDERITGEALYHKTLYLNCNGSVHVSSDATEVDKFVTSSDVIIDAMIGIGVHDELREPVYTIVSIINQKADFVISVDIPTGLPADEGITGFSAIHADWTFVIEAAKMSLFLEHTAPYYGKWEVVPIGISINTMDDVPKKYTWGEHHFRSTLPKRDPYAHKGTHGKGLAIGGSVEMPGSIAMTAKAALRAGAGLLTVGTAKNVISSIAQTCIEATYLMVDDHNEHGGKAAAIPFERFDCIVMGMGMGRDKEAERLVMHVLNEANCPVIVDADGLFHVKADPSILSKRSDPIIVTPHPGEMAMLLEVPIAELLEKPFHYSRAFAAIHQVYVVLKGKHTIITVPDGKQAVNQTGNQGLAKGGSGDVLSGIILAMVMQHKNIFQALCNACFVHGAAADLLIRDNHSYYDLLATDVIEGIPAVYRTFL
ncbi:NAD(P)H-hydrate dehydratase [Virgibacillus dakarensis]|uniref:Bifunctional NAD(P)H-hydrate repair enzyme n=1 Tax=Lentibacillus populi TaxID=1827502 RepID=A0A9W5U0Y4_9BACI|nr:NAD(P)H-hydrate dehydratase [Lentibacillus populi]MTW85688.1 NAD(P)H-hydrate dehydratase [Virgibacillus dakarensis]GGB55557.1 bifunctional NAD(P)H-hydrate repair enzyme Nnr [Lentibacillus populi]